MLIAGAGGGFDIFSGLPLYFGLQAAGKQVHLANLSFSYLPPPKVVNEERLSPSLLKVTAGTPLLTNYFPEKFLAQWFREQGAETPIYCFERTGVKPLLASYRILVEQLSLDTVILVDGGTDSLLRGDEIGLGTPQEDIASITAVNEMAIERKLLACLAFGVDYFHGGCTRVLFLYIHEEFSDGLYDDPHRIFRLVHVGTEMASIPGEEMRCLALLRRGEHRPVLLRKRKRAPLARHIRNKADCRENLGQPVKGRGMLPFQVQPRFCQAIRAAHNLPMTLHGQFDDKGGLPFRVVSGRE